MLYKTFLDLSLQHKTMIPVLAYFQSVSIEPAGNPNSNPSQTLTLTNKTKTRPLLDTI